MKCAERCMSPRGMLVLVTNPRRARRRRCPSGCGWPGACAYLRRASCPRDRDRTSSSPSARRGDVHSQRTQRTERTGPGRTEPLPRERGWHGRCPRSGDSHRGQHGAGGLVPVRACRWVGFPWAHVRHVLHGRTERTERTERAEPGSNGGRSSGGDLHRG